MQKKFYVDFYFTPVVFLNNQWTEVAPSINGEYRDTCTQYDCVECDNEAELLAILGSNFVNYTLEKNLINFSNVSGDMFPNLKLAVLEDDYFIKENNITKDFLEKNLSFAVGGVLKNSENDDDLAIWDHEFSN